MEIPGMSWHQMTFPQTDDHPVVCISWNDARAFCDWAAKKTGRGVRLPTEAEWEYACRAGTRTKFASGDDESAMLEWAWTATNSGEQTRPVGQRKPNAWGLFDMHGNAWEWCQDWAAPYTGDAVDPAGPPGGDRHLLRGGGCSNPAIDCRSSYRLRFYPVDRSAHFGFRVAVS
jgi:formylglycine-generating enzyme required for sulfatase activity